MQLIYINKNISLLNNLLKLFISFIALFMLMYSYSLFSEEILYHNSINKEINQPNQTLNLDTLEDNLNFTLTKNASLTAAKINLSFDIDGFINNGNIKTNKLDLGSGSYFHNKSHAIIKTLNITQGYDDYPSEDFNIIQEGKLEINEITTNKTNNNNLPWIENKGNNAQIKFGVTSLPYISNENNAQVFFKSSPSLKTYVSVDSSIILPFDNDNVNDNKALLEVDEIYINKNSKIAFYVNEEVEVGSYENITILAYKDKFIINDKTNITAAIIADIICGFRNKATDRYLAFDNIRHENNQILVDIKVLSLTQDAAGFYTKEKLEEFTIKQNLEILRLGESYSQQSVKGYGIIIEDNQADYEIKELPDNINAVFEFKAKDIVKLSSLAIRTKIDISSINNNKNKVPVLLFSAMSDNNEIAIEEDIIIDHQATIISKNSPALQIRNYINSKIHNYGIIRAEGSKAIDLGSNISQLSGSIINKGEISGKYALYSTADTLANIRELKLINTEYGRITGDLYIAGDRFKLENRGVINNSELNAAYSKKITIINSNKIEFTNIQAENVDTISLTNNKMSVVEINNAIDCKQLDIQNSGSIAVMPDSVVRNYNSTTGDLIINIVSLTDIKANNKAIFKVMERAEFNNKSKVTFQYLTTESTKSVENIIILEASTIVGKSLKILPNNEIYNNFLYGNNISNSDNILLIYNLKLIDNKQILANMRWILKTKRFKNIKNIYNMADILKINDNIEGINIIESDKRHIYFIDLNVINIGKSYQSSNQNTIYATATQEDQQLFIIEFSTSTEAMSLSIDGKIDGCHDINNQAVGNATAIAIKNLFEDIPLEITKIGITGNARVIGNNAPAILIEQAKNSKLITTIENNGNIISVDTNQVKSQHKAAIFINQGINSIEAQLTNNATITGQYSIAFDETTVTNKINAGNFRVNNQASGKLVGSMQIVGANFNIINKGYIKSRTLTLLNAENFKIENDGNIDISTISTDNNYDFTIDNNNNFYIKDLLACNKLNINNKNIVDISCYSIIKSYISKNAILKIRMPSEVRKFQNKPLLTTDIFALSFKDKEKIILYTTKNAKQFTSKYPITILKTKRLLDNTEELQLLNNDILFGEKLLKTSSVLVKIYDPAIIVEDDYKYLVAMIQYISAEDITDKYLATEKSNFDFDIADKIDIKLNSKLKLNDKLYYNHGDVVVIGKKHEADFLPRNIYGNEGMTDALPVVHLDILQDTTLDSILISGNLYATEQFQPSLLLGRNDDEASSNNLEVKNGITISPNIKIQSRNSPAISISAKITADINNYGIIFADQSNAIQIDDHAVLDGIITNHNKIIGDYAFYMSGYDSDSTAEVEGNKVSKCVLNNLKNGVIEGKIRIVDKNFDIINLGTITNSGIELDSNSALKIDNSGTIKLQSIAVEGAKIKIINQQDGILFCGKTDLIIDNTNIFITNYGNLELDGSIILDTASYTISGNLTAKKLLAATPTPKTFKIAENSIAKFSNVGDHKSNIAIVGPGKLQIVHSSLNGNLVMHRNNNCNYDGVLELVNNVEQQTGRFIAGELKSDNNYYYSIATGAESIFTQKIQQQVNIVNDGSLELQQGSCLSGYSGSGKLTVVVNDNINTSEYLISCRNDINFAKNARVILKPKIKNITFLNKKIDIITASTIKYDNKCISEINIENLISSINSGSVLLSLSNYAVENNGKKITANLVLENIDEVSSLPNKTLLNKQLQLNDFNKTSAIQQDNCLTSHIKAVAYSAELTKLLDHISLEVSKGRLPQETINIMKYLLTNNNIKDKNQVAQIKQKLLASNINQNTNTLIKQLLPNNSAVVNNTLLLLPNHVSKNIGNIQPIRVELNHKNGITNKALINSSINNIWLEISNYKNICTVNNKYFNVSSNSNVISLAIDQIQNLKYKSGLQLSCIKTNINKEQLGNENIAKDYNSINSIMLASYAQFKQNNYKLQFAAIYSNNFHREQINNNIFKEKQSFNYNSHAFSLSTYWAWFYQYNNFRLETMANLAIANLLIPAHGCALESHCRKLSRVINFELNAYLNYTYKINFNKHIKLGFFMSCDNYMQNNNYTDVLILDKKFNVSQPKTYLNKINFVALAKIDISHKLIIDVNLEYFKNQYLVSKAIIHYYF